MKLADIQRRALKRSLRMLAFIQDYIDDKGYPPTRREIAVAFATSTSVVDHHLVKLAAAGKIELTPMASRGIRVVEEN